MPELQTPTPPHDPVACACHSILQMAFKEIERGARSIVVNMSAETESHLVRPSAVAGPLLSLARDSNHFYQTKIRFKYDSAPQVVTELVTELESLTKEVMTVAQVVEVMNRRGFVEWCKRFFVGGPELPGGDSRTPQERLVAVIDRCVSAQARLQTSGLP